MLNDRRRIATSLILIILLLVIVVPSLRTEVFDNRLLRQVDEAATVQVEDAFARALAGFALARVTNGVISVIQESQVAISPAGVGLELALGQVLDPLNDMVERFSWVMLVALTSLGIQRFLIEVSPWLGIELLGSFALLLWLAGLWIGRGLRIDLTSLGKKLVFLALVVRFAVPLTVALNQVAYQHFLADRYAVASSSIAERNTELQQIEISTETKEGHSWWQQFRLHLQQAEQAIDFERMSTWLKQRSTQMINSFLDLLVVFLLNSVLLPLAFLWGVFRLFKAVSGAPLLPNIEQSTKRRIAGENPEK